MKQQICNIWMDVRVILRIAYRNQEAINAQRERERGVKKTKGQKVVNGLNTFPKINCPILMTLFKF